MDSLNDRFVRNWPFGPSFSVLSDGERHLAFVGSGGGVYVIDVSNPSSPMKISEKVHTKGFVRGIFYDGFNKRFYLACEVGVEILDISDSLNPVKLGSVTTPGKARGVHVSGSYAYVADEDAGLRIIEISDPLCPNEVSYYNRYYDHSIIAADVFVEGSYAFVADYYSGLLIVDISNPLNPQYVSNIHTGLISLKVYVTGSYAYLVNLEAGFKIYDISNPSAPQQVGYYNTSGYT